MNTNGLIRALSADLATKRLSVESRFAAAVVASWLVAIAIFAMTLGPRPDLASAVGDVRFLFKFVVTLMLALCSAPLLFRLVRPGAKVGFRTAALLIVPLALTLGVATELIVLPRASWIVKLIGSNGAICLMSIPLFGAPILAAALFALRQDAPTKPGLTGAAAGLFAGAIGGAVYAAHCPDDSPLFVALWYSLAIALVAVAGAAAGRFVFRW